MYTYIFFARYILDYLNLTGIPVSRTISRIVAQRRFTRLIRIRCRTSSIEIRQTIPERDVIRTRDKDRRQCRGGRSSAGGKERVAAVNFRRYGQFSVAHRRVRERADRPRTAGRPSIISALVNSGPGSSDIKDCGRFRRRRVYGGPRCLCISPYGSAVVTDAAAAAVTTTVTFVEMLNGRYLAKRASCNRATLRFYPIHGSFSHELAV